jgi:hypothetical protein
MYLARRLAVILLLCAAPAFAQRVAVWTASVTDFNGQYVFLEFYKDGARTFADRYPLPANGMPGVRVIVRDEIKRLSAKDAIPALVRGPVTPALEDTPPPPPPDPTPEELALRAFQAKVVRLENLRRVLPASDADLRALEAEVATDIKAHPEWEEAL